MAPREIEKVLKDFAAAKVPNLHLTSTDPVERPRQYKNWIRRVNGTLDTLKITDEDQRVSVLTVHEFDLVFKVNKAVDDNQVTTISGNYKKLLGKLDIYLEVSKLRDSSRRKLREIKQHAGQPAADVLIQIKELFEEAEYDGDDKNEQIRDTLLNALRDDEVRRQWRYSNMSSKTPLTIAQIVELANTNQVDQKSKSDFVRSVREKPDQKATSAEDSAQVVNDFVKAVRQFRNFRQSYQRPSTSNNSQHTKKPCDGCGSTEHAYKSSSCRARNNKCSKCNYIGHFPNVCRSAARKQNNQPSFHRGKGRGKNNRKSSKWSKKVSEDPFDDMLESFLQSEFYLE